MKRDEDIILLVALFVLFLLMIFIVVASLWPMPEIIGFSGSFIGALAGGLVTLFIMWKTLKHSEQLQQDGFKKEEKENARKLVLLWAQQKYEIEALFIEWNENEAILQMRLTLLELKELLDILGTITSLSEEESTKILDINSNLRLLEQRRAKYAELCNEFTLKHNQFPEMHNRKKTAREAYIDVVRRIYNQVTAIDDIMIKLQ